MSMKNHPTVKWFNENSDKKSNGIKITDVDYKTLKDMAVSAGADDCGIADIYSAALEDEKNEILSIYPETKAVISIVIKLNRENVQCVSRSVSDHEFLQGFDSTNSVGRKLTASLKTLGIHPLSPSAGFPMDVSKWPGKMWTISHKTIAVAAGMGRMGHNRLLMLNVSIG